MSNNVIEKILSDAKQLNGRLKQRDTMADDLITATMNIQGRLKIVKQFRDMADQFDKVARHRPRLQIIQYLAKESHKIKELEEENTELRQSLEEHQTTLELIMNKYREQMEKLNTTLEMEEAFHKGDGEFPKKLQTKDEKIEEMAAVMLVAADHWDEEEEAERKRIIIARSLEKRNRVLRSILLDVSSGETEVGRLLNDREGEDCTTPLTSPQMLRRFDARYDNNINGSSETLNCSTQDLNV